MNEEPNEDSDEYNLSPGEVDVVDDPEFEAAFESGDDEA
jgi:hypothetical protein